MTVSHDSLFYSNTSSILDHRSPSHTYCLYCLFIPFVHTIVFPFHSRAATVLLFFKIMMIHCTPFYSHTTPFSFSYYCLFTSLIVTHFPHFCLSLLIV